ncbi:hypothetical protein GY45DRAFT_206928 [Cubamyces sp. BRFM 1775]|nr:hypothetical protein GY45DRAFT_206928 [Cubamyces sp. BRFM 1775]
MMQHQVLPMPLPTEIHEEIIQWAGLSQPWSTQTVVSVSARHTRLSTLYSCALTCRAWLPTTRTYLYHDLTFIRNDKVSLERLVRSLEADPWLQTLIYNLNIVDDVAPGSRPFGTISNAWVHMLAYKLPHLRALGVVFPDGLAQHPRFFKSMRALGSSVMVLSLEWNCCGSFADLFRLLAVFPNLLDLTLDGTMWTPTGIRPVFPLRRFPSLCRLAIVNCHSGDNHALWREVTYMLLQAVANSIEVLELEEACMPFGSSGMQSSPCTRSYTALGSV